VEFFLLVAAMAIGMVLAVPWVLAHARREETREAWPTKIVRTHSAERAGDGAYRGADVEVERVVSVESGAPADVARSGRRAFSTAAMMFVGGVLAGAWVPVQLWITRAFVGDLTAAYVAGLCVSAGWVFAAFAQFRAAWDRWEPSYAIARSTARAAARAATVAVVATLVSVVISRAAYGAGGTLVPVWFALVAATRAWLSSRSVSANEALYASAESNREARRARAEQTGVRVAIERDEDDSREASAQDSAEVLALGEPALARGR
jgi:hypothetical protein